MPLVPKIHIQTIPGAAVSGKLFASDQLCQNWSFGTKCIWKCLYHACDTQFRVVFYWHLYIKDITRFFTAIPRHPSTTEFSFNTGCSTSTWPSTAILLLAASDLNNGNTNNVLNNQSSYLMSYKTSHLFPGYRVKFTDSIFKYPLKSKYNSFQYEQHEYRSRILDL